MASFTFARLEMPSRPCVESAPPGTRALQVYLLDRFSYTRSMGVLSCRNVANTDKPSKHIKGWAFDCGVPTTSAGEARRELGMPIVELLGPNAKRLGIDELIYDRVKWRANTPSGAPYGGKHPHKDHVHIGLTALAAAQLNGATLDAVLGGRAESVHTGLVTVTSAGTYVVQKGDSMAKIASTFGIPLQTLIAANPQISNPDLIRRGQVIHIPGQIPEIPSSTTAASTYVVQKGDSMAKIASTFGIPLQTLIAANPQIPDPDLIRRGQVINIP
ncbi:MAG TPA: LysM peptidoglycan-binding domain-containing protein [Acidimicrobiia bacterium]|nr:LysM peptidoglycan-binding domain-containing protein [Acidimicrobiia bacterium]